jgi:UDP-N-acetylglucosamine transferase subunit ALG13
VSSPHAVPLVLVAVGTDHHRYDRAVEWVDAWLRTRVDAVDVLIQYGHSQPPTVARGSALLDHADLQEAMARATVIVCHGGPATITEARRHGKLPICMPRDPERGEHVDNHQQLFARRMGAGGVVHLVETQHDLWQALDDAVEHPDRFRLDTAGGSAAASRRAGLDRFADLVQEFLPVTPPATVGPGVPVLYLGGLGRSGSTLLERSLGQIDGLACIGESVHLWERGLRDDELCGCGSAFSQCSFWQRVGKSAFGGWDRVDVDEVLRLKASVDRTRFARKLFAAQEHRDGPGKGEFGRRLRRYGDLLTRLYAAVLEVSGADVVVDASKHASTALVLAAAPGIDLKVLHVVRDSPAVAYSWTKQIPRPEAGPGEYMATWSPAQTAVHWSSENWLIDRLASHGTPTQLIRYEDFAAAPRAVLADLVAFLGRDDADSALGFIEGSTMHLDPSHTVAGNPMRFSSGSVDVVPDQAWRAAFPPSQQRLVSGLTLPLRHRYGYPATLPAPTAPASPVSAAQQPVDLEKRTR